MGIESLTWQMALIVAVGVTRRAVVFIAGILTRPLRKR